MQKEIYAGIITYNPDISLLRKNISSIINQIDKIVIVDNFSNNFADIEKIAVENDIILIRNSENKGIACALNQAMEYGKENGYYWMLSLDQDSACPENYYEAVSKYFSLENIGIIAPVILDRSLGIVGHNPTGNYKSVNTCITSGACTKVDVWDQVGKYDEQMFIDSVDFEFCYRVRRNGYLVIQTSDVQLIHSIGEGKIKKFFFIKKKISEHSPFRCFYIAQNRIYYPRKHHLILYVLRGNFRNFVSIFQVIFFETDKRNKIIQLIKGWINGYKLNIK